MTGAATAGADAVRAALGQVRDPEIPEISIVDLGIVRDVAEREGGGWRVTITPTYSGCPAYETIHRDILDTLAGAGFAPVEIVRALVPPWTTDWMSERAKSTLRKIGIAPPGPARPGDARPVLFFEDVAVPCPRCGSADTELTSRFGATACKALLRCRSCLEPFEHFKPL